MHGRISSAVTDRRNNRKAKDIVIFAGITVALAIAIFAPYYASTYPDGLDSTFLLCRGQRIRTTIHIDEAKIESAHAAVTGKDRQCVLMAGTPHRLCNPRAGETR